MGKPSVISGPPAALDSVTELVCLADGGLFSVPLQGLLLQGLLLQGLRL